MEIRIKLTEQEFKDLSARSKTEGFPSVTVYARDLLFPTQGYKDLWKRLVAYINELEPQKTFYVRDAVPNAPALIGRWVFERQNDLGIDPDGTDRSGTNRWRKR